VLVYRGPSALTGELIIGVVTGVQRPSKNAKTGPMAQLWVLPYGEPPNRQPSVCGSCALGARCYVQWWRAPYSVWRMWRDRPVCEVDLSGRALRLGAAGDPAALPQELVEGLCSQASGHTGYTAQWARARFQWLRPWVMASVSTAFDLRTALAHGWRAFYCVLRGQSRPVGLGHCPAAAGRTTCAQCMRCNGAGRRRSVWVHEH
jgi:hypothetical protein